MDRNLESLLEKLQKEGVDPKLINNLKEDYFCLIKEKEILERQRRLVILGELLSGIAHDINNCLSYAIGNLELYEMLNKKQKNNKYLSLVKDSLNNISELNRNLLDYSKSLTLEKSKILIYEVHNFVLRLVKPKFSKKGIIIYDNINETKNAYILGNKAQLIEVFLNLLKNSSEAITKEGKVFYYSNVDNNNVTTYIKDNGCGIHPNNLEKIFEPYYTTKKEGTGLGLYICKRIIKEHNGKIICESKLNKGTTFIIKLPLYKESILKK